MTQLRTLPHFDALDKREQQLAIILADPTFTGTKEDASIKAGYARGKTVFDKLRDDRFVAGLQEIGDQINRQIIATNIAKRQRIMDALYAEIQKPDTSPLDKARCAETWGKYEGSIGTGGNVTHVSVTQSTGAEELLPTMARVAENRRRVLATEE